MEFETADCTNYKLLKAFAYKNRGDLTEAEQKVWEYLKNNQLGYRFRRQHIIGDYIVDFVCLKKKLVVEIDGEYHLEPQQQKLDAQRTEWLTNQGFNVIRFTNKQVFENMPQVLREIKVEIY